MINTCAKLPCGMMANGMCYDAHCPHRHNPQPTYTAAAGKPILDLNRSRTGLYDAELGRITDEDRENARDACEDLGVELDDENVQTISEWFRKVRYEAVMADRKKQVAR